MASSEETHQHRLIERKTIFDHFLQVDRMTLQKKQDGEQLTRFVVKRPDATAIVLYNAATDQIVLVKQLRVPALGKEADPYLWELPAGVVEAGESPSDTIVRETEEETGFHIAEPRFITACYASPGVFEEKIYLFYSPIAMSDQAHEGGGLVEETEDLEIRFVPVQEAFSMMDSGTIMDAKTLIALYWFRTHYPRLYSAH